MMAGMMGWLLCAIGRHDWDEFGECRRNWKHVQMYPGEMFMGASHFLHGTEWSDGPWTRVANRRAEARRQAGLELQAQMAALGTEASLELCKDAAQDPSFAKALLETARKRRDRRLAHPFTAPER